MNGSTRVIVVWTCEASVVAFLDDLSNSDDGDPVRRRGARTGRV